MMRFPAQGSFPEKLGQGHGVNQKIKWCSACGPFFMLCNPSTAITPRLQTQQKHFKHDLVGYTSSYEIELHKMASYLRVSNSKVYIEVTLLSCLLDFLKY